MTSLLKITIIVVFCPVLTFGQLVDFENLPELQQGDFVGKLTAPNSTCSIEIVYGNNLRNTKPLTLQKVGYQSDKGGFYGVEFDIDCENKSIPKGWSNQVNTLPYVNDSSISNRERIGCYFISTVLKGNSLPSIFIIYEEGTHSCSADLIDVDGHENTIEAYDIYYYNLKSDYPFNPINKKPIAIRAVGNTHGMGILGDNGGVLPFKIESDKVFTLIEIRPIQQVNTINDKRLEFGFALDNFSPCSVEEVKVPIVSDLKEIEKTEDVKKQEITKKTEKAEDVAVNHLPTIEPVFFDFDSHELTVKAKQILDQLIVLNKKKGIKTIYLTGFTDPKGSNEYNLVLSQRRVKAVKEYLLLNGFNESQFIVESKGEQFPDFNKEDWEKRTVIIRIE